MVESMGRVDKGEGWGAPLRPTAWALAWPWPGRGLRVVGSAAWGARSRRPGHVQLDGASPCFSDASTWLLVEAPAPLMTVPGGGVPARQHTRQGQMLPDRFLRWSCHLPSGQQCGSGVRLHAVPEPGRGRWPHAGPLVWPARPTRPWAGGTLSERLLTASLRLPSRAVGLSDSLGS